MDKTGERFESGALHAALEELYGDAANRTLADVAALIAPHRKSGRQRSATPGWSEDDVWLIAYPDQFQAEGESPLATLRRVFVGFDPAVNGLHILPCYPWTSDDGYSITDYLQIDPTYGSWADIEALAAEGRLMLDAVVNHMSAGSDWFKSFLRGDPDYAGFFRTADPEADLTATVRPRTTPLLTRFDGSRGPMWVWTTFSADQVDLDYRTPRVFVEVTRVLLEYAKRGAQMIRLDAVQFIGKEEGSASINLPQAHKVIRALRAALDLAYPSVLLVTESNVPHHENVAYLGRPGEREAQVIYQFPLAPLVLHTMLTGDATILKSWVGGLPTPEPGTTYLNFLASHDGVAVRPVEGILLDADVARLVHHTEAAGGRVNPRALHNGESAPYELACSWFDLMAHGCDEESAMKRHAASHAIMFALQGIPAVYVHSLFGTGNDHDLAAKTGVGRSLNRRRFSDMPLFESWLTDPTTRAARMLATISSTSQLRRGMDAFSPDEDQMVLATDPGVFGVERGGRARMYVNVKGTATELQVAGWVTAEGEVVASLEPWQAVWLRRADG